MVTRFESGPGGVRHTVDRLDLTDFEALLLEQRRFRRRQLRELDNDLADQAPPLAEVTSALRAAAEQALTEVEAALDRIAAGTFGDCTRCGEPILAERLEIVPMAALCMTCQRVSEVQV